MEVRCWGGRSRSAKMSDGETGAREVRRRPLLDCRVGLMPRFVLEAFLHAV